MIAEPRSVLSETDYGVLSEQVDSGRAAIARLLYVAAMVRDQAVNPNVEDITGPCVDLALAIESVCGIVNHSGVGNGTEAPPQLAIHPNVKPADAICVSRRWLDETAQQLDALSEDLHVLVPVIGQAEGIPDTTGTIVRLAKRAEVGAEEVRIWLRSQQPNGANAEGSSNDH